MSIFIHGTIKERDFLANKNRGFKPTSCWSCSENDRYLYLWCYESFKEELFLEEQQDIETAFSNKNFETFKESAHMFLNKGYESAVIQAAHGGKATEILIYVLDIPSEMAEPDDSCENMNEAKRLLLSEFKKEWIVALYTIDFKEVYAPFVIAGMLGNTYFNANQCDEVQLKLAQKICQTELTSFVWEDLSEEMYNLTLRDIPDETVSRDI